MQFDPTSQTAQVPANVANAPDAATSPTQQPQAPQGDASGAPTLPVTATPVQPQAQAPQPSRQTQTQSGSQPGTVSNSPAPDVDQHPAVQHASLLRTIAQTLAGGPRFKTTIDPNTGATTRTPVPLSKGDIAMAILAESLGGAVAGLTQRGPGATGRAAAAGFSQVSQQQEEAQQQAAQQAQTDANNQANALARRANIADINSRTLLSTAEAESRGADTLAKIADTNKSLIDAYEDQGALLDRNVTQEELMAGLQSGKYNSTSMLGPIDGYRLIGNGRVEATHALIRNPAAKVPLTQSMWDDFAANHVQGFPKDTKIGGGVQVPGTIIARANEQKTLFQLAQQRHDEVTDALQQSDDPKVRALADKLPKIGSLLDDPQRGAGLANALSRFQSYVSHADISHGGRDIYESLLAMAQPSMPDPNNPKQSIPNRNAPFANQVAQAFSPDGSVQGGWNVLKTYHDEVTPEPIKNEGDAASIIANNAPGSRPYRIAQKWIAVNNTQKADQARADAQARKAAEGNGSSGNPSQYANEQPVNGVRQNYLSSLPPTQAELVRAIGEGRTELSSSAVRTKDGQAIMQQVSTAYPGYDFSRAPEYAKTRQAFTSGKTADAINALNTAMGHMLTMYQNATLGGSLPIVGGIERAAGNQSAIDLANSRTALVDELGKAYKAGALTDQDVKSWKGRINAWTPAEIQGNARSFVQLLDSKLGSYEQQWRNGSPPGAVAPIQILSPEARNAYQLITGKQPITGSGLTNIQVNPQTHQQIGWNGQQWVDIQTRQPVR